MSSGNLMQGHPGWFLWSEDLDAIAPPSGDTARC